MSSFALNFSLNRPKGGAARQRLISLDNPQHEHQLKSPLKYTPSPGSTAVLSEVAAESIAPSIKTAGRKSSQLSAEDLKVTPPYRYWKGSVIPCWLPGCKNILFQASTSRSNIEKMHYCPE